MRDIKRGPVITVVTEVCRSFLYLRKNVRRRDITKFICGDGPAYSEQRSILRTVVTNSLDDLVAQGYASPGRITKVSDAPTGSGEIKFWMLTGRPPKWSKLDRKLELERIRKLVDDSQITLQKYFQLNGVK